MCEGYQTERETCYSNFAPSSTSRQSCRRRLGRVVVSERGSAGACSECALGTLCLVGACTGVKGVRVSTWGFLGVVEVGIVQM